MQYFDLSIIVVNYNTRHLLDECFSSLDEATKGLSVQCLLVENASTDGSQAYLQTKAPTENIIFNDLNVGFGRANNQAVPFVQGRYVLLLNTDAFVAPDTLTKTIEWMDANPDCGVLGVRLTGRAGDLQPSCRYFPSPFNIFLNRTGLGRLFPWVRSIDDLDWDHASVRDCDWVTGCYYLMRREVLDQVGLFDPRFFMYYEEVDHCRRVKAAGWNVVYYPHTSIVHIGGESAKSTAVLSKDKQIFSYQLESELLYMRKHYGAVGLAAHVFLLGLGDAYIGAKQMVKRLLGRGSSLDSKSLLYPSWQRLVATGWASRPTR